jgi:hypothetical protein
VFVDDYPEKGNIEKPTGTSLILKCKWGKGINKCKDLTNKQINDILWLLQTWHK